MYQKAIYRIKSIALITRAIEKCQSAWHHLHKGNMWCTNKHIKNYGPDAYIATYAEKSVGETTAVQENIPYIIWKIYAYVAPGGVEE